MTKYLFARAPWLLAFIISLIFGSLGAMAQAQPAKKNYVVNLTGSMRGYGDITGPIFTMIGFKKKRDDANIIVLVDRRAEEILNELYSMSLDEIGKDLGFQFFLTTEVHEMPKADISFELFFGGRFIHDFQRVVFNTDETAVVISDTMHGTTLDEVRGANFHFYFKPPGIGPGRSGIIKNPEIEKFRKSVSPWITTAHFFDNSDLKELLLKEGWRKKILFSFVYGVHNEIFKEELNGQTQKFAEELKRYYSSHPIIIFSPNSENELLAAKIKADQILTLSQLGQLTDLPHSVYFLPLTGLNNAQFIALMSIADLPILVEGNSSLSAAIGLQKEFLMMRSAWNTPQIQDLLQADVAAKTFLYSDVYPYSPNSRPLFSHYLAKGKSGRMFGRFILEARFEDFSDKLVLITRLIEELKKDAKIDYLKLMREAEKAHDEYLEYSLVSDLFKRRKVSALELYKVRKKLESKGKNAKTIESRLKANQPNFSRKIQELEAQGFLFEDIRRNTSPLNAISVQEPLMEPTCLGSQHRITFDDFSCANNWENLTEQGDFSKVVWTYWDKGAAAMPAFNRFNVEQWRRILGDEWAVVVVSGDENDPCYYKNSRFAVDQADLPRNFETIEESISSIDRTRVSIVQSDIIRLALLKKYGGVWLDSSIVLLNPLDSLPWTYMLLDSSKEIAGYVNEGQSGKKFKKIDGFENWFIAAKRGSKVISEWLEAFNQYWETKKKDQDITEHPMYRDFVNLNHISPYYRNYLSQHAAMAYVLTKNPKLVERFVVTPAAQAFAYADVVSWDPDDIYEMFVNSDNFAAYREIFVDEMDVDFLKFPSENLQTVKRKLSDISMYKTCDNLVSYLYDRVAGPPPDQLMLLRTE